MPHSGLLTGASLGFTPSTTFPIACLSPALTVHCRPHARQPRGCRPAGPSAQAMQTEVRTWRRTQQGRKARGQSPGLEAKGGVNLAGGLTSVVLSWE